MCDLLSFILLKPGNQTPMIAVCFVLELHQHGLTATKLLHWKAVIKQHGHDRMQLDGS